MRQHRSARVSLFRSALLWLALLAPPAWAASVEESELKAAIVYNLLLFVDWPAERAPSPSNALVLCLRSGSALLAPLERLAVRPVRSAPLELRLLPPLSDARPCHVLYADGADADRAALYRRILLGPPPVVIADDSSFGHELTAIQLRRSESKFTLEVNPVALRLAGVQVSSKLLRLAKMVRE